MKKISYSQGKIYLIYKYHISDKGLVLSIYKGLSKLNNKRTNNPMNKVNKRCLKPLHQRRCMENEHIKKKWPKSLVIREIKIKTTMNYHLSPF